MEKFTVFVCVLLAALSVGIGACASDEGVPVVLTVNGRELRARLDGSRPARSLAEQLPLTVTLNDSGNDFCGGSLDIEYGADDVRSGYKNGELAFWTPAGNFVIFVGGEENSSGTGDLVRLGEILEPQEVLDSLEGRLNVTIRLAGEAKEAENLNIRITAGGRTLTAALEDNSASRAFAAMMPLTLKMEDLYGRELCHRFGAGALPTEALRSDGYEVGDIAYWPPRGSLVILYAQNGERFERQHLGRVDGGIETLSALGDAEVRFELIETKMSKTDKI